MAVAPGARAGRASQVEALAAVLDQAMIENADGSPSRAARRLRPALRRLEALPPSTRVEALRVRATLELIKADFEVHGDVTTQLARLDALAQGTGGPAWPQLAPAVAGLRGLLHLRTGRVEESLHAFDEAIEHRADADSLDVCRALLNRGVLHMDRGDLARARADLLDCAHTSAVAGRARLEFKAKHNLGYLEFLAGRLPLALQRMEEASRSLPGPARPIALLDRSRVLLEAGLVAVADATLAEAAGKFAADGLGHDLGEAELVRAECAMLRGDAAVARALAESARRRFVRRGDDSWAVRAALLGLQIDASAFARVGDGTQDARVVARSWRGLAARAQRLEQQCASSNRPVWAYAASLVRLEAQLALGPVRDALTVLAELGPVSPRDPIGVRLHGRRVRALLALGAGDQARASRHVRAGQRDLAGHRARFGSLDLRTAGAVHGTRLAEMDLALALAGGHPGAVLDAAERARALVGAPQRVNPPSDPDSAALLAELRQLLDQARGAAKAPANDPERVRVLREAMRLKQAILARSWLRPGEGVVDERLATVGAVRAAVAEQPGTSVLDVVEHRGQLLAVRVQRRGGVVRASLHLLGDAAWVREQSRRMHADLEVMANPLVPASMRQAADRSLRRGLDALDGALGEVVRTPDQLVVVAAGWLGVVPWSMLASRGGRATVVAPSVSHWLRHAGSVPTASLTLSAAAGPGLRHAADEVRQVGRLWPGGRVLLGAEATCAQALEILGAPGIVHLAAHGRHEPDNPLFSSIRMADGPLFAHELDAGVGTPALVVLSCCEVGRASVRPGGEALGLASVLLRRGVGCVVAALAPLPDETALGVMTRMHTLLRSGLPVAQALATATAEGLATDGRVIPLVSFGSPV